MKKNRKQTPDKPESRSLLGSPKQEKAPQPASEKPKLQKRDPYLRPWTGKRGGADRTPKPPKRAPEDLIGTPEYYEFRAEDYRKRNPGKEPPSYLMDYGHKYAKRFTEELRPELSPAGQQWLDNTRELLQRKMEDGLAAGKMDEYDQEAFEDMAFDMHSDAYLEGGIRELPLSDLWKIGITPDSKEWKKRTTWEEAAEASMPLVGIPAARYLDLDDLPEKEKWIKTLKDGPSPKTFWDWSDEEARQWIGGRKRPYYHISPNTIGPCFHWEQGPNYSAAPVGTRQLTPLKSQRPRTPTL